MCSNTRISSSMCRHCHQHHWPRQLPWKFPLLLLFPPRDMMLFHSMPSCDMPCRAMPCNAKPCHAMPRPAALYATLWHAMPCRTARVWPCWPQMGTDPAFSAEGAWCKTPQTPGWEALDFGHVGRRWASKLLTHFLSAENVRGETPRRPGLDALDFGGMGRNP